MRLYFTFLWDMEELQVGRMQSLMSPIHKQLTGKIYSSWPEAAFKQILRVELHESTNMF